ncbi:MAG: AAA family ATPase [Candidatus Dormiibacterota bacterium]
MPTSDGVTMAAILVDEAVLPGEQHYWSPQWDDETALAAELQGEGAQVVMLPREFLHGAAWPAIGLLACIDSLRRGEDGTVASARLFGLRRIEVTRLFRRKPFLTVETRPVAERGTPSKFSSQRLDRLIGRAVRGEFRSISAAQAIELRMLPPDVATDRLAAELSPDQHARAALLAAADWSDRLGMVAKLIGRRYRGSRRASRTLDLDQQVKKAKLPAAVCQAAERALHNQLGKEGAGNRDLVRLVLEMRWDMPPPCPINMAQARSVLDASHSDLGAVKEAVLDYLGLLAWRQQRGEEGGTTLGYGLCLVGPPGVGKTSIAEAIARAAGRRLERIPVGGLDDVYLLGADRSYSRARPGEIVRRLRNSRAHPTEVVFLLDEIDKVPPGSGHPALPVLLALLDPTQNREWRDHFLEEVPIDLSGALFIATANDERLMPPPLKDRLRFIHLPAYTAAQQLAIGRSHLLPKLLRDLGIESEVTVDASALSSLVHDHPPTDGCRQLEQRLQVVLSRALRTHLEFGVSVTVDEVLARAWIPPERRLSLGFRSAQPSGIA